MKKIFGWVALLVGMVTGANAQVNDTIQRTTGNDLYQGITRKLPSLSLSLDPWHIPRFR